MICTVLLAQLDCRYSYLPHPNSYTAEPKVAVASNILWRAYLEPPLPIFCHSAFYFFVIAVSQRVEAYTRNAAVVDSVKGGFYSILNGQITGEFVELTRPSRIVMKWREKTWPESKSVFLTAN